MRQEEIVLRHLEAIGSITQPDAYDLYRIKDLPKRVSVLRQEGHSIDRTLLRGPDGRRWAHYLLRDSAQPGEKSPSGRHLPSVKS